MDYQEYSFFKFYKEINSEKKAIEFVWKWKLDSNGFLCRCGNASFYKHKSRPEIRECKKCGKQHRVRVGTIFESSKISLTKWLNGLFFMMSGKRGISALELQRHLDIKSYRTAWGMLQKIRRALIERDSLYKLSGEVEVDGSQFGSQVAGTDQEVIIGVESKKWVDEKGREKSKAGFAQIMIGKENKENAKKFISKNIQESSTIFVDGAKSYEFKDLKIEIKAKATLGDKEVLSDWHPWMHRFVSNAKVWILGTHHGINPKYLNNYLGEYVYRFNRRHDTKRLFSRALKACLITSHSTILQISSMPPALSG
jgi:transposase-like protein